MIKDKLNSTISVFHGVDLVAQEIKTQNYKKVLLLATRFTMEDGFFLKKVEQDGIDIVVPSQQERVEMHRIHEKFPIFFTNH